MAQSACQLQIIVLCQPGPAEAVELSLPGTDESQKRLPAAGIGGVRMVNVYVPNREAAGAEKFSHKLVWLQALRAASMPPRAGSSAFGPYTGDRRIRLNAGITRIRRAFPEPPNISAPA